MSNKRIIKKVGKSILYLFISVAILVCLFLLFINMPVGRRVVKNKVQSYLEDKFKSKVIIGSIDYSLPKWIEINNVYLEDMNKDTLLYGEKIYVDVDMYRLAFGFTNIREVVFKNIVINVQRGENDTVFNYQFVLDAFAGNKPTVKVDQDTVEMKLTLSRLLFDKVLLKFSDKKDGVDFTAYIKDLDASLNSFRPERANFAIQNFRASQVDFDMTMYKEPKKDTAYNVPGTSDSLPGNGLKISAVKFNIRDVNVSVKDKITGMYYTNNVKHLALRNALFDMPRSLGTADSLLLDSSFVRFTNPLVKFEKKLKDTIVQTAPWHFSVKQVSLSNNQLWIDDNNVARAGGFDLAHFNVKNLGVDISDLIYSENRTQGLVKQFTFKDTSGFNLDTTHMNFLMTDSIISATDLYVKTPESLLQHFFEIKFDSLSGITKHPRNSLLAAMLHNSTLAFNDLYLLMPSLKTNFPPEQFANTKVFFNTEIRGNLAQVYLPSLQLLFGGSTIKAHGSLYNLTNAKRFYYDLYIDQGIFRKSDLLKFIPKENQQSFAQLPNVINLRGRITGNRENLVSDIVASGEGMMVNGKFSLKNISDPRKLSYDFAIRNSAFSKKFIMGLIPPGTLPPEINLPERNMVTGTLKGNVNDLVANLKLNGSYGQMTVKGFIKNIKFPETSTYDLFITTTKYDIGKLISQDSVLGKVTGSFKFKGRGLNYKTMRSDLIASIKQLQYKNYNYQNAEIAANFNDGLIDSKGSIDDPNLKLQYDLNLNVRNQYPAVNGFVNVDTARLQALNLYRDTLNFSLYANIGANSLQPRSLDINTVIDSVRLQLGKNFYLLDSISLIASSAGGVDDINFHAPFASVQANGAFDYDKIDKAVIQYINHYYKIADEPAVTNISDQQVIFSGLVKYHPIITAIVPGLTSYNDIDFKGSFVSANRDSALNLVVSAPLLTYDNYTIRNGNVNVQSRNERINYAVNFDTLRFANTIFYGTTLNGSAANDSLLVSALTQDDNKRDWFGLKASAYTKDDVYSFRLIDSLLLNYERWNVASDNYIKYSKQGLVIHNFLVTSDTSRIFINSRQPVANSPIDVLIDNFNLKSISSILNKDTVLIAGIMDTRIEVSDLYKNLPAFTGTLTITDLAIKQQPIGNLSAWATKQSENNVTATMDITGNGNDIRTKGNYYLNNELNQFDANADIRKLNIATLQGFTMGSIKNATGNMHGDVNMNGKFSDPRWKGTLFFDTTKFTIAQLGTAFKIDNQKIVFDHPAVTMSNFIVRDTLDNELKINGTVTSNKAKAWDLNLDLKAKEFIVMNAPKAINSELYGYAAADIDIRVTGTSVLPNIEGDIAIKDRSNVTIVIPERSYSKDEGRTIVRFIDRDTFNINPPVLPFVEKKEPTSNFAQFLNYNLNVEIKKDATLTIIIDPVTGDEIKVKGDAVLNAGVDPGGNIILAGVYELDNGYYLFNYQFLQRKFILERGSTITFAGEPMNARADITATYIVNTSARDLLDNEVGSVDPFLANSFNQKIPFRVKLYITGVLNRPEIKFDIQLPDESSVMSSELRTTIENKLAQIRGDEAATNKQVFALLLLGRFVGEQSSDFFKGNGDDFSDIARHSVSQFLSDALNQIAGNLLKGVDVDLNLNTYRDYTNGGNNQRTDLNVALSKTFLDDRLTVTLGKNFGVQGQADAASKANSNFLPDISIGYKLTKDGKYLLKAYRKNQFEVVLDGYVVETGLGFVVTMDYDKFRELFVKKRK